MKKLNFKKLTTLPKGKYHDGNGLYITISKTGSGKWSFHYSINQKSSETLKEHLDDKEFKFGII